MNLRGEFTTAAAYPLVTDIGVDPKIPVRSRNMLKAAQLGAKQIARVKIV